MRTAMRFVGQSVGRFLRTLRCCPARVSPVLGWSRRSVDAEHSHLQGEGGVVADQRRELEDGRVADRAAPRGPGVVIDVAVDHGVDDVGAGVLVGVFKLGHSAGPDVGQLCLGQPDGAADAFVCGALEESSARRFVSRFPNARVMSLSEQFGEFRSVSDVVKCLEILAGNELTAKY